MAPLPILTGSTTLLKRTTSRCPTCRAAIPAEVHDRDGAVVMVKACPEHGRFEVTLARDRRFHHLAQGCRGAFDADEPTGGCCPPARDPFDVLSTCVALIEIVETCNLTCPTCYAASPLGVGDDVACVAFDDFVARVQSVIDRKGFIDILQLSGGEPTLHPEFLRVLEWSIANDDIGYVLVNTNLVRVATDDAFRARLGAIRRARRKFELYAQFDGTQEAGQVALRGADLRATRRRAIDAAGAVGVPTTLVMVVTPETRPHLGDAVRFGLARPHCRGLALQPMFTSGRIPPIESRLPIAPRRSDPISVGDVILDLVAQAPDLLTVEDFTPLPCADPNCHTIGYLLRTDDGPTGLSRLVDLPALQGFLRDRVDYDLDDLARCGCEAEPLGNLLRAYEIGPDAPFRIFIKPFMDAWTFDQDRIDRCCTHVIRPDGTLDSFCRHYLHG
jgi:uncharacterized radical SAM superfamily Fe-S cluster-containing enzyme